MTRQKRKPASQLMGGSVKRQANNVRTAATTAKKNISTKTITEHECAPPPMEELCKHADSIFCKGSDDGDEDVYDQPEHFDMHDKSDASNDEMSQSATKRELNEIWESMQDLSNSILTTADVEAVLNKELGTMRSRLNNMSNDFQEQHKSLRDEVTDKIEAARNPTDGQPDGLGAGLEETKACVGTLSTRILLLQQDSENSKRMIEEIAKQIQSEMDVLREDKWRKGDAQMDALREKMTKKTDAQVGALRQEFTREKNAQIDVLREEATKKMDTLREEMATKMDAQLGALREEIAREKNVQTDALNEEATKRMVSQMDALREEVTRNMYAQKLALREEMTREKDAQMASLREEVAKEKDSQRDSLREENTFLRRELESFKSLREEDIRVLKGHVAAYLERNKALGDDINELRGINKSLSQANEATRKENEEYAKRFKTLTDWVGQISTDGRNLSQAFSSNYSAIQHDVGAIQREVNTLFGKLQGLKNIMAQGFQGLGSMLLNGDDSQSSPEGNVVRAEPPPAQQWDQQCTQPQT